MIGMPAPTHLKSFQAVELAARTGSLAGAAAILNITPAALGQRVKLLEDFLGVSLFHRGRFGIEPTPELLAALPHLRAGFASIGAAADALELQRGHDLHLAVTSDFAELWLGPRLASFRAAFPNTRFSVNGEGDAPMRMGKVDCEISFAAPDAGEDADILFHDLVLPLCSRANAERTRALPPATRLEGFPLLHVDFYRDDPARLSWPSWFLRHRVERTAPERGMRFRRIAAAIDAVKADAGVALCGVMLLGELFDSDELGLPFPDHPAELTTHAFVARYRRGAEASPKVAQFRRWLKEQARQSIEQARRRLS